MRLTRVLLLAGLLSVPVLTACRTADSTGPNPAPSLETQGANN